jgi:porphobilinogen synthase
MTFPANRMRRMRRSEPLRALVRETVLDPGDLIYPLFICPGKGERNPVGSMPGVFRAPAPGTTTASCSRRCAR